MYHHRHHHHHRHLLYYTPPKRHYTHAQYSPTNYTFAFSSSVNRKLTLFTQCLSSVGVGYPSPLNTCPKCPPQLLHTISVLSMPNELSVYLFTAPGTESKYAGQPQPDLNLCEALYRGTLQPAQVYTPWEGEWESYSPVKGRSVPFSRRMRNCSVERYVRIILSFLFASRLLARLVG